MDNLALNVVDIYEVIINICADWLTIKLTHKLVDFNDFSLALSISAPLPPFCPWYFTDDFFLSINLPINIQLALVLGI